MVRRDVGQDRSRRSTRSPCRAGRCRHGRSRGRRRRCRERPRISWAPPGPVQSPGLDHPLVDEDAVRGRRPDVPARRPSRMWVMSRVTVLLPFVPDDRHDRDPPVGVADPGRRRRPGLVDPLASSGSSEPVLGAGQLRGPRRRHVALGERERGLGERARPLRAGPRERDDPVARDPTSDGRPGPPGPRRGRPAAAGPRRRPRRSGRASRAPGRRRRAGRARAGPDRAGRTTSGAGRCASSSLTTGSSR